MVSTQRQPQHLLAEQMVAFARSCAETLESSLLVDGLLPPTVRGYRLGQEQRDERPHMGGSDAENRAHFSAFLALLRRHVRPEDEPRLDDRIARSVRPYLTQRLVPFPHRAVLQTLWEFGPLSRNTLWAALDPETRAAGRENLFDLTHYYDPVAEGMRTLPDNYLWITAENAWLASRLLEDQDGIAGRIGRSALRRLLAKLHDEPWFDDRPPAVVIDQYAWETVAAAARLCRAYGWGDELERLAPVAERYLRLFRRLVRDDGYAVCWGRSQGIISYGTTIYVMLSLGRLLAERGRMDEEELGLDLESASRAFATLANEWFDGDGLTTMHREGRMPYVYRGPHRLVGSTFGILVKMLQAAEDLAALDAPRRPSSREGTRLVEKASASHWEAFREPTPATGGRAFGVWVGRSDAWHVTLPVVGNNASFEPKLGSNYLPAPIVPFVLDVPTQQSAPYGTEFIELADGSVWSASDGCDRVDVAEHGLTLTWSRLVNVDTGALAEGIGELSLTYELRGDLLTCRHVFATPRTDIVHRYALLGIAMREHERRGARDHRFRGSKRDAGRELHLRVEGALRTLSIESVVDLPAGRGFLGSIPWVVAMNLPVVAGETVVTLELRRGTPVVR